MSVLLRAEIHGLAGRAGELRDVLRAHVAALATAEGSEGASASVALDAEYGEMVLESWWHDEAALRAHYATTEYRRYTQAVGPLLARPSDVVVHYVERSVHATADPAADPARLG
jgi:quinol monooxygenase YgiN